MVATRHETGLVAGDQHVHAAVPHLSGPVAKCGAGKIVQKIPGWFNPAEPTACPACVERFDEAG